MSFLSTRFLLPDLFAPCPQRFGDASPHYKEAGAESTAWINSYHVFSPDKELAFLRCCNELLCSRVYPYADYESFRTCCDFVNLLFVIDDLSDEMDGEDARDACDTFYQCMLDPEFRDASALAQMTVE